MISLHERHLETADIISQAYDGCARAVAFCINPDHSIIETENISFNQRFKACNKLKSHFRKFFWDGQGQKDF